ncbi:hypothetical protein [Neolewinella antarctica]|uniref:LAGLIDADG homing endonuclease n=1 Tax=Neolewinella antarctica TaxID=442734 RepID=A0ABX0X7A1_9BACT|nr:hypothetical protein [Neolewinella antarctica]NJC25107.1 hypothetical protein [Neolewinella antarctica]
MLSPTKNSLKKVETLAKELGYTVRYEKGHFQSGYCLVESKKVVVVNRFFDTEGRLNVLYDVLSTFREEAQGELSDPSRKLWKKLRPFLGIRGEEE